MKIGIDISQIAFPGTGVGNYVQNLARNINYDVLFASSLRRQSAFAVFPKAKVFPFPPTLLDFLWNQAHILPIETLIGQLDIFHTSDWTQPPSKAKKVTTIFDLVVFKYPETSHPK